MGELMTYLSKCNEFQPSTTQIPFNILNGRRLTKGTDELSLYCPGDCLYQRGRGETSKQHVVKEDNVEVPEPVISTKVSQQVEAGDP